MTSVPSDEGMDRVVLPGRSHRILHGRPTTDFSGYSSRKATASRSVSGWVR